MIRSVIYQRSSRGRLSFKNSTPETVRMRTFPVVALLLCLVDVTAVPTCTWKKKDICKLKEGFGSFKTRLETLEAEMERLTVNAECSLLNPPDNGCVSYSPVGNISVGASATYTCNTEYQLAGAPTRTCLFGGLWSGSAPTCNIIDCGTLASPENGDVSFSPSERTTFLSTAIYSCSSGFQLNGQSYRTCQSSGQWSGTSPVCCPEGWLSYNNHCYSIILAGLSWENAKADCVVRGSQLVEVNDQEENNFLHEALLEMSTQYDWPAISFWSGGNDIATEGTFVWDSGNMSFTNWKDGEPNDYLSEDCLDLVLYDGILEWNDNICDRPFYYICETM